MVGQGQGVGQLPPPAPHQHLVAAEGFGLAGEMIVRIQRDKEYFQLCIEEDCIVLKFRSSVQNAVI